MTRVLLTGLVVLLTAGVASGQMLYRYVDERGQVHMTDDPNKIPKAKGGVVDAFRAPRPTAAPVPAPTQSATGPDRTTERLFELARTECAQQSGTDAYSATGRDLRWFGTPRERFNFERCMARSGFPISGDR